MKQSNSSLKPFVSIVICFIFIMAAGFSWLPTSAAPEEPPYDIIVSGDITTDTTWSGKVLVTVTSFVRSGVTLTIDPGTMVYFAAYQGYKEPEKRISLVINGSLDANGTAVAPIYFTSDAAVKTNGDYFQLGAENSPHFHLHYVVQEFAIMGLNMFNSTAEISNTVIRWNNFGINNNADVIMAIDYCQLYGNGAGGINNSGTSDLLVSRCEIHDIHGNGVFTVNGATTEIRESILHHLPSSAVAIGDHGKSFLFGINFHDVNCAINRHGSDTTLEYDLSRLSFVDVNSPFCSGTGDDTPNPAYDFPTDPSEIPIGFTPDMTHDLGYIPGDLEDRYPYVYDTTDETRTVVDRIGPGNHGGGLAWDGSLLWSASGETVSIFDPSDGELIDAFIPTVHATYGKPESFRGLTFDDEGYLWGIDGYQHKVYKIDPVNYDVEFSFTAPNAGNQGVSGIEWDGSRLCMLSWSGPSTIFCTDKSGTLLESIMLQSYAQQGGLTWADGYWWASGDPVIGKFDRFGRRVGWIYAPAFLSYDLAWEGEYLWVASTTYSGWEDELKLFKVQILDDHHHQSFLPITIRP